MYATINKPGAGYYTMRDFRDTPDTNEENRAKLEKLTTLPVIDDIAPVALATVKHDRQVLHVTYVTESLPTTTWKFATEPVLLTINVSLQDNTTALTVTVGTNPTVGWEKYALHEEFEFTGDKPVTLEDVVSALTQALENLITEDDVFDLHTAKRIQEELHQEYLNALKQQAKQSA